MNIVTEKKCENCGKTFSAQTKKAMYCSHACQNQGWRKRHAGRWEEYNRQWRADNPGYWKEYYQDGRGKEVQRRRHESHPLQRKARSAISNALRLGKIIKPIKCQACGCVEKLEAHHWKGYEKEHWLDVQWLCHKHHLEADNG